MIISKRAIVLFGIACIFFFALLNRIHIIQKSEMAPAYAQRFLEDDDTQYFFSYTYKGKSYKHLIDNDFLLKNKTTYRLLILNENPKDFLVFNFMGFWFVALLVSCVISVAWLIFTQAFFEKVANFKLALGKKTGDENEIENENEIEDEETEEK